jgi:hypothetical protein
VAGKEVGDRRTCPEGSNRRTCPEGEASGREMEGARWRCEVEVRGTQKMGGDRWEEGAGDAR